VIAELCDDVVVMYAGEVVERGDVRQVFNDARHPYTMRLLECDPARQAERTRNLPTIPGEVPDLRARPKGCVFRPDALWRRRPAPNRNPSRISAPGTSARCHKAPHLLTEGVT
jgi:oligopeptide/dipeptide ABC transporter ATP-binding protein